MSADEPEVIPLTVITRDPSDEEMLAEIKALAAVAYARRAGSPKYSWIALHLDAAATRLKEPT